MRKLSLAALLLAPVLSAQVDRKPHLDNEGKVLILAQTGIAVADYWSTKRGIAAGDRLNRGKETNWLGSVSDGYQIHTGKFIGYNAALIGGTYGYEKYLKHRLPPWAQNTIRAVEWTGSVYLRGYIVGRNVIRGNSLINSR